MPILRPDGSIIRDGSIDIIDLKQTVQDAVTNKGYTNLEASPSTQFSITANTWTKLRFEGEKRDKNNEFDITTSTFTPNMDGIYGVTVGVRVLQQSSGTENDVALYVNGVQKLISQTHIAAAKQNEMKNALINASFNVELLKGDTVELFLFTDYNGTTVSSDTFMQIVQLPNERVI